MMSRARVRTIEAIVVFMVLGLPLLGAWLAGRSAQEFFRFPPPLEIPSGYVRFSWFAAAGVCACVLILVMPLVLRVRRGSAARRVVASNRHPGGDRFPIWGVAAALWTGLWWVLAWTRWTWFEPLQRYTFFPLWIGFIVTVNAMTEHRTGSCLMRRSPIRWIVLFMVSAVCWWVFEWLNRFVENWHYLGAEGFGPASYAVHASLCFSTVLPAVAGVAEWIASHADWKTWTTAGPRWRWLEIRGIAVVLFVAGTAALVCTGAFPRWSYPALWIAPLVLFLSLAFLRGGGLTTEIAQGNWSRAATWMMAAMICGFFWELWNWHSVAKWIYTVPGVERWHVFEMPLLGYAGYLPFGLECLLVTERVVRDE